ncbi:MAG: hypothetical protein QOK70_00775 [Nitrososphaeraceae archaeon]|nr:hypothetical protein [Nitrososphaeraceae archaeon]MDW0136291.1 hypothetical protein [Nitrososphaeraceae archaeon]MDW0152257.1 hypothetical protein [Nitrososphaeraceae archaeon]HET9357988.1 hypothetical protein [Nitrososphaeraceae archaeon]
MIELTFFPNEDILTREIQAWSGFADALREEDRVLFLRMLKQCYQYIDSINSKGEYYSTESLLISLIFVQHKIIDWLINNGNFNLQEWR